MKWGSVCTGYGGLDMAAVELLGGEPAWFADNDPAASKVLAHHWPGVPNLGDITRVGLPYSDDEWAAMKHLAADDDEYRMPDPDWSTVESVDGLTAGYPCQPFSLAGRRAGTDDARHLWPVLAGALAVLRPRVVLLENVMGHLTIGFDEVVRDLHRLGYDCRWAVVRASDIGAAHRRARLFVAGVDRAGRVRGGADRRRGVHRHPGGGRELPRSTEGSHDRQGLAKPEAFEGDLRRQGEEGPRSKGDLPRVARLDRDGPKGDHGDPEAPPLPAGEGPTRRYRAGVPGDARSGRASAERTDGVDRRDAQVGESFPCSDSGGQPPRAGSGPSALADRQGATGRLSVGRVVGAERRPVWAGAVRRSAPIQWPDDLRAYLRDAAVGCAHLRWRVFLAATDTRGPGLERPQPTGGLELPAWRAVADAPGDGRGEGRPEPAGQFRGSDAAQRRAGAVADTAGPRRGQPWRVAPGSPEDAQLQTGNWATGRGGGAPATDTNRDGLPRRPQRDSEPGDDGRARGDNAERCGVADGRQATRDDAGDIVWRDYEPAIRRHEQLIGRSAPTPTVLGARGGPKLSPYFTEWLMGLPEGHVTSVPGLSVNDMLRLCGNGVVRQQAVAAYQYLLPLLQPASVEGVS